MPARAARFRRGLLVHALLARLPEVARAGARGDRPQIPRRPRGGRRRAAALTAETLAVLAHPDFAPAFAANARAEVAIVADLPELGDGARINGRIDRLAVTDGEVLAVDFKTNRPPPARPEDVAPGLSGPDGALPGGAGEDLPRQTNRDRAGVDRGPLA